MMDMNGCGCEAREDFRPSALQLVKGFVIRNYGTIALVLVVGICLYLMGNKRVR